jgi:serine/threonine protein kinase
MIGQTISHYRIISKLGEGGMGVVYLAEDTVLGRHVAVKTLTDGGLGRQHFRTRFLREARAVSALSHPNIATIYDYGETREGNPFIVMEFVKGQTLAELISGHKLSLERSLEIIIDVARALGEAHLHGIVHRDIKPSNIAINERGQVKVLDFGLAKQFETGAETNHGSQDVANTQTREGIMIGTPMYVSPEQAMGVAVDARSDLFSLGSVLYECLAGHPAFSGISPVDICAKVIRDDPPPPSSTNPLVTPELDRISLKSLAKKPEERYQTAELCVEDLRTAEHTLRTHPSTAASVIKIEKQTNGGQLAPHPLKVWRIPSFVTRLRLAIAAAIVLFSMIAFLVWRNSQPHPYQLRPDLQVLYSEAVRAMHQGSFFRASKILEQVVAQDDHFALGHARLAEVYAELDWSDRAKTHLIQATQLAPDLSALAKTDRLKWQAVTEMVKRDFAKAVVDYSALLEITPPDQKPSLLIDLGRAYQKNDEPNKALDSYQEAAKLDPNSAAAFLYSGVIYGRLQRWSEADAAFDRAYKLLDTNSEIEGLAEIALQRAVILTQQGKVSNAREQLNKALEKSIALENQDKHIRVLLNLSNNAITSGELPAAKNYSAEALKLALGNKMENLAIQGLIDVGNKCFLETDYPAAEKYFLDALDLAQRYKAERSEARANISLASLRTHQNDSEGARNHFYRAKTFFEQGGYKKELAQAYTVFGHALDQNGDYDIALTIFQEQLKRAEEAGDQQQIASAHEGLGVVLNHTQRYAEALDHFQNQYSIVKSLGNNLVLGYAAMNAGTMSWQLGNYQTAEEKLNEAMRIAEATRSKELQGWTQVFRAQMLLSRLNYKEATDESKRALQNGKGLSHIYIQATSTLGLAQAQSGATTAGLRNCETAVKLARDLKDPLPLSRALLALAQAQLKAGKFREASLSGAQAEAQFAGKQHECEWRALLIQAEAKHTLADSRSALDLANKATRVLASLEQDWGNANYLSYLARPDIELTRKKLNSLLHK